MYFFSYRLLTFPYVHLTDMSFLIFQFGKFNNLILECSSFYVKSSVFSCHTWSSPRLIHTPSLYTGHAFGCTWSQKLIWGVFLYHLAPYFFETGFLIHSGKIGWPSELCLFSPTPAIIDMLLPLALYCGAWVSCLQAVCYPGKHFPSSLHIHSVCVLFTFT